MLGGGFIYRNEVNRASLVENGCILRPELFNGSEAFQLEESFKFFCPQNEVFTSDTPFSNFTIKTF